MNPPQPPFPTDCSLRFQSVACAGIQTSISICESDVGAITAATRQCAWRGMVGAPCWLASLGLSGPSGTTSAAVIVVSGRDSDFKVAQSIAGTDLEDMANKKSHSIHPGARLI